VYELAFLFIYCFQNLFFCNLQMIMFRTRLFLRRMGMYDQYQDWRLDVDNMTYEVPSFCIYQSCKAVCRGESPLLTFSFDRNCSILRIEWDMRVQGCARMRSSEALGWSNTRHSTPTIFQQKWIGDVASAKYIIFFSLHSILFFFSSHWHRRLNLLALLLHVSGRV
jgi:hypothetical protein